MNYDIAVQVGIGCECGFDLLVKHIKHQTVCRYGEGNAAFLLILKRDDKENPEGYCIYRSSSTGMTICGNGQRGLIYGIGAFLRADGSLVNGEYEPVKKIRGMYFATHFYNFYHSAPLEKVYDYIEELMLWGCNVVSMWFDMHQYSSIADKEAQQMIERMKQIYGHIQKLGMKTSMNFLANEYYSSSPAELRATNASANTPYKEDLCGFYHMELCPSKEEGLALLLQARREVLHAFRDIAFDYIWIWPYDQGGCTCEQCYPWGANGFWKCAKSVAEVIREECPNADIVLSAWRFDVFADGEWDAFLKLLQQESKWFDLLMIDAEAAIPEKLCALTAEKGIGLIGFPEISMVYAVPWGGFGANPVPAMIEKKYKDSENLLAGGFPYSEGVFEDINKVLYLQMYWGGNTVSTILETYCCYYFSAVYGKHIAGIITRLERTLPRQRYNRNGVCESYPPSGYVHELPEFRLEQAEDIPAIYRDILSVDQNLLPEIKISPRWRMVYLRACIDYELYQSRGFLNAATDVYAQELTQIYAAGEAYYVVSPVTRDAVVRNKGSI